MNDTLKEGLLFFSPFILATATFFYLMVTGFAYDYPLTALGISVGIVLVLWQFLMIGFALVGMFCDDYDDDM